jgi:hypothetical protein
VLRVNDATNQNYTIQILIKTEEGEEKKEREKKREKIYF